MLVRRNTKEYKGVRNIITHLSDNPARQKLISLYIVKAGESLDQKVAVEDLSQGADFYYDMTYDKIIASFQDRDRLLHKSEEEPDLYYFQSSRFDWPETPFRLDESLLENLPKFARMEVKEKKTAGKPKKAEVPKEEKPKADPDKLLQQRFGLKRVIRFHNTGERVFMYPEMTRMDILEYYNKMYKYMEYYIQNRLHSIKIFGKQDLFHSLDSFREAENRSRFPDWIRKKKLFTRTRGTERDYFYCPDKDHFFALLSAGVVEIHPRLSRWPETEKPDYLVINLKPNESGFAIVVEAALIARSVLEGCRLPSYVTLSERWGLHIYLPLDGKSDFEQSKQLAELLRRMIQKKDCGRLTSSDQREARKNRKVYLDISQLTWAGSILAPYSLIDLKPAALVSAPLTWDEVSSGLDPASFTPEVMPERLEKTGDLFHDFRKHAVNAEKVMQRLDELYGFLV